MATQIQFRRGTFAEHETFTGAPGEITVDTTNNTLRVHDGHTTGGTTLARADAVTDMTGTDYVVAWQSPTADNNYTWYRKYRSGWCEQGGLNKTQTVNLIIPMADTNYHIFLTGTCASANNNIYIFGWRDLTTTSFTTEGNVVNSSGGSGTANTALKYWTVYGFAAQ